MAFLNAFVLLMTSLHVVVGCNLNFGPPNATVCKTFDKRQECENAAFTWDGVTCTQCNDSNLCLCYHTGESCNNAFKDPDAVPQDSDCCSFKNGNICNPVGDLPDNFLPTPSPTQAPITQSPTTSPTIGPTTGPMTGPTTAPTTAPTASPTFSPSLTPSVSVMPSVSVQPTESGVPMMSPTTSESPTKSLVPTSQPSSAPSSLPSSKPSVSAEPTLSTSPSSQPSSQSSSTPSVSAAPSISTKPTVSSKPTVSAAPSASSKPTESVAPTMSSKPTASTTPTLSIKPTVSAAPTVTSEPTISAAPSTSSAPSIPPTISAAPSTSSAPTISNLPTVTAAPSTSSDPTITAAPSTSVAPTTTSAPTSPPTIISATIGPGNIWKDENQNGIEDGITEAGLGGIGIGLYCSESGQNPVKIGTTTTDTNGVYIFTNVKPGQSCFIQVETDGYLYSPIVSGGNQLGPDGRSLPNDLKSGNVIDFWDGGLFLPFTAICKEHCPVESEVRECSWGVWNPCTCQCDCNPGVCLSAKQQCYEGCTTHEDFNPWGGCRPGHDCPWIPSKLGEDHCESSANFAGVHNTHETAEICCEKHFSYRSTASCVGDSIADVQAEEQAVQERLDRPRYYWPDLHGKKNCVFDSDYYDWMDGPAHYKLDYLFDTSEQCCGKWYPKNKDCPILPSLTTPQQLDYKPDASDQFYYPHLASSNCRFGRNYPMWMKMSPKHYLYRTPEQCCSEWYPAESNCPTPEDDGVQEGFYWQVDHMFYPNFKGDNCATGNSYPEWMADPANRDTHLFKTGKKCCDAWFPARTTECQAGIVTVIDGHQTAGPDVTGTWYPSLNGIFVCIKGSPPSWMTSSQGYKDVYVFDSHSECCKAHWCDPQRDLFAS